jgi:predicted transcriptional regulator
MTELTLILPDELMNRLQDEAHYRQLSLDDVVRTAIIHFFDEDEPTKQEILAGLREAMQDALAGRVRPAHEMLDELDREMDDNP